MNTPATFQTPFAAAAVGGARFSVEEYVAICEATGARFELIDGELERMTPPMGTHSTRQGNIFATLWIIDRHRAKVEAGVKVGEATVLTCDIAWLHASMQEHRLLRPDEVGLTIEVAQTTLSRDLGLKRALYAAAGIPEYWVVDGDRAVVHVYREPVDGDYAMVHTVRFGEALAVPGSDATIAID